MDFISRLAANWFYWPVFIAMLALLGYGVATGELSFRYGPSVSLVLFLFGAGLVALWRQRNRYLRAVAGPDRHLFRGVLYERFRRREAALRALSLHLERFPGNAQALQKRAELLQGMGRADEALADLDAALAPHPDPELLDRRGLLFLSLGANEEALEDFERACVLRGRPPGLLSAVALIELRLLERAREVLDTPGPEEDHRYLAVHRRLYRGEALRLLGREDEARAAFEETLGGLNSEPAVHDRDSRFHCVPDVLGHLGRNDEARQLIEFALHQRKVAVNGLTRLTVALRAGSVAEARDLAQQYEGKEPNMIVSVLSDPEFTSFLSDESLKSSFVHAIRERAAVLKRIRARRGP